MIVTVQGVKQNPEEVEKHCTTLGLEHFFIDMHSGGVSHMTSMMKDDPAQLEQYLDKLEELIAILITRKEVVLVHCQAGFHRTGITAYTLLRVIGGLGADEAYAALAGMR